MRLGLTGSFGSGKTTVSEMFRKKGFFVIDADEIAREVTTRGRKGFEAIVREFGEEYLTDEGKLDRKKLAHLVFNDSQSLKKLESIVHPLVRDKELELLRQHDREDLVVVSVPLMYEAGMDSDVDKVAVVAISPERRYERLQKQYGISREEIDRRLRNQMPQEEKIRKADYVIDNNGTEENTKKQVEHLIKKLLKKEEGNSYATEKKD